MCEVDKLTTQLLESSKQLAGSRKTFQLTLKTKDIFFSFTSQEKDVNHQASGKVKIKSPNQKMRDFKRRQLFLKKKLDTSTISTKLSDQSYTNNVDKAEELETLFNCDECDYKRTSIKGLQIHKGKLHKI